ncbi:hypothetical protein OROGR_018110 [Orobanche gracilis]
MYCSDFIVVFQPILMTMDKPDPSQKLYNKMRLWEFPDQYVVEPTDGSSVSFLAISRLDGSMSVIDDIPQCNSLRVPKIQTIYGVVGMLKLLTGKLCGFVNSCGYIINNACRGTDGSWCLCPSYYL